MAALQRPKGTDAIQDATREAARVPLEVARKALEVMALAHTAVRQGNPNAVSDGAVGALLARAALQGALLQRPHQPAGHTGQGIPRPDGTMVRRPRGPGRGTGNRHLGRCQTNVLI